MKQLKTLYIPSSEYKLLTKHVKKAGYLEMTITYVDDYYKPVDSYPQHGYAIIDHQHWQQVMCITNYAPDVLIGAV